jgi:hypothetical protein
MSKLARHVMTTAVCGAALMLVAGAQAQSPASPTLQSASALAFAPNGVLLVGDSLGGAVYAFDTGDKAKAGAGKLEITDLGGKVAALLGTTPDQIAVRDMAVNPLSGNVYLAVSRGSGPTATPVLLKADRSGKLSELSLTGTKSTRLSLVDTLAPPPTPPSACRPLPTSAMSTARC